jgi:hypothetical protein
VKVLSRVRDSASGLRAHWAVHFGARAIKLTIAILAAAIVATLTIDLGPSLRLLGERQASKQIKRPVHIGRLSIHVLRGSVVVENFSIEGLSPTDRPFFTARRLELGLDWMGVFRRRPDFTITSVEMTDWQMLVEKWDGRSNFPKFGSDTPRTGERPFTTTLNYFRGSRGQFTYEDHQAPWSAVARNLDLNITNLPQYHGKATFNGGTITIQDHLPMWANFTTAFTMDGSRVHLSRIDIETDGAETTAEGDVDFAHWPNMTYKVKSRVHFPRMREIFFTDDQWTLFGDGDFTGTFRLFDGGHDLTGTFASQIGGVNDYRFPALRGSLRWTQSGFEVWDATAKFYGGDAKFQYSIKPLGVPTPSTQRFDVTVARTDLAAFTDFEELKGLRFGGSADGHIFLEWPSGRFSERRGTGQLSVSPPPGVTLMTPSLDRARAADADHQRHEWGPFAPTTLPRHLPIGGRMTFRLDPGQWAVEGGEFVTERTHTRFDGAADWDARGRFAFHVTSADFQEADQLLAGIITDFGSPTGTVAFGGRGTFDGTMTGPFRRPRVEGTFRGEDLRAWDTLWGDGSARVAIENDYIDVRDGIVRLAGSEIHTDGKFSLGYRDDAEDEIDARFRIVKRDLLGLRHAFELDEYPMTGLFSGELHLTGPYRQPLGFGAMTIEDGRAYGQPMQKATASLRFDGRGIRLNGIDIGFDRGGGITGVAFIGWDSTYSFNADGRRIPVDLVEAIRFKQVPISGLAEFTATGNGTFDTPRNDFKIRVDDLVVGDERVGQVTGSLALRGNELSGDLDVASPRLALTAAGRIALTPQADCEISLRFHDSSLDPYVKLFLPSLSQNITGVASGSLRVVGELADLDHLLVDATVDSLEMRTFDYALRNAAPIRFSLDQRIITVQDLQIVGEDTELRVAGRVGLGDDRIALQATGGANLGILQAFFHNVRGSGRAELRASVDGPLRNPVFSGNAIITNGRIRHLSLPNALDAINGAIRFDSRGIQLDEVTAMMGGGPVQFSGRVGLEGYLPGELNVLVSGHDMHLRYPEGIQSVIDADLTLRGNMKAPVIGGSVNVQSAVWSRRLDAPGSIVDLVARATATSSSGGEGAAARGELASPIPIRFDLEIKAPSAFRMETNLLQLNASADLTLRGSYDRPILLGRAEVDRGLVNFEGRRYRVTRGTVDFNNPNRIDPFIDVEAETNVRVPGQTYHVTVSMTGTPSHFGYPTLESDPPLPQAEVVALLLSDVQPGPLSPVAPELQRLQNPNRTETDILRTRATQALSSPLSSTVGRAVEQTFGVDTFQVSPSLTDPTALTPRLSPTARVTIGKRISERAYLTFSRSLNSTFNDQIILLEYEASDRYYWVFSRNEDQQTYALELRVRHSF